jgi:glycine cleavage system transcriptional repressor
MSNWYMVTVVGRDRPGIVANLSRALFEGEWTLGETSMARLGGNFTIMMMVQGEGAIDVLSRRINPAAESLGLHVHVDSIEAEMHKHPEPNVEVRVYGADRAGIIADVTSAMADAGLNILDLNSEVGGTEASPVYVVVIDGVVEGGVDKLESAATALNQKGLKVDVEAIDTMLG